MKICSHFIANVFPTDHTILYWLIDQTVTQKTFHIYMYNLMEVSNLIVFYLAECTFIVLQNEGLSSGNEEEIGSIHKQIKISLLFISQWLWD